MVAILGGPTKGNRNLLRGLRRLGLDAELVPGTEAGRLAGRADVVLGRLDVLPSLDGVEPGLDDLYRLQQLGVRVVNTARALLATHDKHRTWRRLARAGVRQPRTAHVRGTRELARQALPFVVKPRFGSWGRDVMRCASEDERDSCLAALPGRRWFNRHGAIVQELVPIAGRDLRVLVADGSVAGAVQRLAAPGEWRTNVSLGGTIVPVEPDPGAQELALDAAAATGAGLVGVDLLPAADGWLVLELNGAVDFDGTYSLAGRDVYEDIASALALRPVGAGS